MDLLDALRAKSDDSNGGAILLKDHLYLTIERAIQLKRFIIDNQEAITYNKLGNDFFRSLYIACLLHDLGKIDLNFQEKLYGNPHDSSLDTLRKFFKNYRNLRIKDHEVISILYSLIFLDNNEWDKKIRTAILLHHYNDFYANKGINARYLFDEYPDLSKYLEFMLNNKDEIRRLLKSLLDYIKEKIEENKGNIIDDINHLFQELNEKIEVGYDKIKQLYDADRTGHGLSEILKFFILDEDSKVDIYDFFVFLGALRRCDYAASANIDIEYPIKLSNDVYSSIDKKIKDKIGGIERDSLWQEELINKIGNIKRNIVLIAPTGSGKTEFALLWASKKGKKLIYTLPLRVALNDLYWRFGNDINGYFNNNYLNILHSTAFIEYVKAREYGREGRYGMVDVGIKQNTAKLFSTPIILTTPDQVFLTSLKYYTSDKLISIYPLSTIIIDEVQAYKPEMVAIILKTIEIIQRLQGDIIIITATFPPYVEKFIKDKFDIIDVSNYIDIREKVKNYNQRRHCIDLIRCGLFKDEDNLEIDEEGLEEIKKQLEKNRGKNILIIVNNVKKAIRLYERLKEMRNEDTYLLHSRLLEKEKSSRISRIREVEKREGRKRIVLVATQIVEASVDIDFDILITEISPIDSQIQRWGRIYRNRDDNYTSSEPNILIFTKYDKGTTAIYDKDVIEQTICVLERKKGEIMAHEDEVAIIKEVYNTKIDDNKTLKDSYIEKINEHLEYLKYFTVEKKSHAQRLFREIAGLQIIVPAIMSKSDDKRVSTFGELIEKRLRDNESDSLSWSEIINKIKEETQLNNLDEWYLKRILYEYSINIPFFLLEKLQRNSSIFRIREFKGYYVLTITNMKYLDEIINEIKEYGIDKMLERVKIDTYKSEIEIAENII
ncbi:MULTISPECIES: CRISPR-associated helicase/endonuclease Cas3 [Candidatus Nitrosocaldus]|jgi:CRISPR-associated endonuclease/helicase Cas3|uniref:CRISPR-associated nuclease/helicase Cas3 n=1 Tax=Candidatus Nitrosocaldus cavascurensis TaxID=2058097 RepID=A0A2K5ATK8_9ARCH|nr:MULTISPECIES: CRISPR-associated helicase/endonuclease Cas3 [Candidatus Nitrosocaldus]SPC34944.1 CRISPR-associated nuclease/helicase Cas3 [Candidatus Nitrosocaldus cavascurensis]